MLAPSRVHDGPSLKVSGCSILLLSILMAPSRVHDGPSLTVSPRLAKASTKALPLRPGFSKMSTKALPQAFRRLIVLSGCSIFLLSILKIVVSFWSFFQLAPSRQVFQNDLFKRSSQVVLVGSSFLKFHPFSCIARRHSSTFLSKYISIFSPRRAAPRRGAANREGAPLARNLGRRVVAEILAEIWVAVRWPNFWPKFGTC